MTVTATLYLRIPVELRTAIDAAVVKHHSESGYSYPRFTTQLACIQALTAAFLTPAKPAKVVKGPQLNLPLSKKRAPKRTKRATKKGGHK